MLQSSSRKAFLRSAEKETNDESAEQADWIVLPTRERKTIAAGFLGYFPNLFQ
jgi:hypothetical protein